MVMSYIFSGILLLSLIFSLVSGQGQALSAAVLEGAQSGLTLALSLGGSICLWSGVGKLMEGTGLSAKLSRLLMPLMGQLFPSAREDSEAAGYLSANFCANLLGLSSHAPAGIASDELCRLVVMNTASIQLIPANVAALRASLGVNSPFGILPAVWVTSLCSVAVGLTAAYLFGKVRHG